MTQLASRFFGSAIIYAVLGMTLGLVMGMTQDHSQMPTHAHLMLLGWVSFAIFGVFLPNVPGRVPYRAVVLADFSGEPFRCSENDKVGIAKLHKRNLGEARISALYDIITHLSQNAYDAFSAATGRGDC